MVEKKDVECEGCGKTITYTNLMSDEEPEVPENPLCIECKAYKKNGKRYLEYRPTQNKEGFEDWKERRKKFGNPVDEKG